ncbi:MAG TPA: DUF3667 domain-containing protein [Gemmatirosa sp.]
MPRLAPPLPVRGAIGPARDHPAAPPGPDPRDARCPNCNAASPRAYCADCGQAQRDFHRPLHTFASDLFESLTGWDHKIPATFGLLLARPGALTREFLAGRRRRYLSPFQLYVLASAILFLALRTPLPGGKNLVHVTHARDGRPATAAAPNAPADTTYLTFAIAGVVRFYADWTPNAPVIGTRDAAPGGTSLAGRVRQRMEERRAELDRRSSADASVWLEGLFLGHLGTALSLLIPVFALVCAALWRRARIFFAEHAIFACHVHAQGLLAIAAARVAPGPLALVPVAWTVAYLWLAARRVYGAGVESPARTTGKVMLLVVTYSVAVGLGLIVTLLASLMLGA